MNIDAFKNFAKVTLSTGYDASATTVVLTTGGGALLPAVSFNATWWNATDYSDPTDDPNVEIVRITNISTDTLTITRAQEGTSASTKNTAGKTYKMIAGLTAKTLNTDIPAVYAPLVSPSFTTPNLGTPSAGILTNCTFPTLNQSTSGNAATATKLAATKNINGIAFDGSADIETSAHINGWITVSDSWSYASASTITVPSGAASLYTQGDRLSIVQSSATKYFYIIAVADTLLTVTGGTDYTVANSTISSPRVSHMNCPADFPINFAYSPSFTGFSSNPTGSFHFTLYGRMCFVTHRETGLGTKNASTFEIGLPITAAGESYWNGRWGIDSTPGTLEDWYIVPSGTTCKLFKGGSLTGFPTSGSYYANLSFFYNI